MEVYQLINEEFGTCYKSDNDIVLSETIEKNKLSEEFIEKIISSSLLINKELVNSICAYQELSENFIRKYSEILNWGIISKYQILSEELIDEFSDKVKWSYISAYQKLSETFIDKHEDDVSFKSIFERQKLSERFIRKCYYSKFYKMEISKHQNISEKFIETNFSLIDWDFISMYQKLSEDFMNANFGKLNHLCISIYQKLSKTFIEKHKYNLRLKSINDNWIYKPTEEKKQAVIDTGKYECHDDYFIAYKAIRPDRYSLYNFQYKYEKGGVYESWCDCSGDENSFGLNVGTKLHAEYYGSPFHNYIIVRCKIKYEDIGRIVHGGDKIRCFKIEILD